MTAVEKFDYIIQWYSNHNQVKTNKPVRQQDANRIKLIEKLIGESFPHELSALYEKYDGDEVDENNEAGSFMGYSLVGLEDIIDTITYAKDSIKPQNPFIPNPEKADKITAEIIRNDRIEEINPEDLIVSKVLSLK